MKIIWKNQKNKKINKRSKEQSDFWTILQCKILVNNKLIEHYFWIDDVDGLASISSTAYTSNKWKWNSQRRRLKNMVIK